MDPSVFKLVDSFSNDPFQASRIIRQAYEDDPEAFRTLALQVLRDFKDSPGSRYITTVLSTHPDAVPLSMLANPKAMELSVAVRIAEAIQKLDASLDQRLFEYLSDTALDSDSQQRVLDILDGVSTGPRLLTAFRQFSQVADPRLVSKFALVAAKKDPNRDWFEARLLEPDSRIRANVVEGLWGQTDSKSLHILRLASKDTHNRVLANAAVGLYLAGQVESLSILHSLIVHLDPIYRRSGIWAIGRVCDTRFHAILRPFTFDPESRTRTLVFQALSQLNATMAQRTAPLEIELGQITRQAEEYTFSIPVTVRDSNNQPVTGLKTLDLIPSRDDHPVCNYEVFETSGPRGLTGIYLVSVEAPVEDEVSTVKFTIGVSAGPGSGEARGYWHRG